LYSVMLDMCP